jgi:hypothetical protein
MTWKNLLAITILTGACNTPQPPIPVSTDDDTGWVDWGSMDEGSAEQTMAALLETTTQKRKCPDNSSDPICLEGRRIAEEFGALPHENLMVDCNQTAAAETMRTDFDMPDLVRTTRSILVNSDLPEGITDHLTFEVIDKAGLKHTIEGMTGRLLLNDVTVASFKVDSKNHMMTKMNKKDLGALGAVLSVVTNPEIMRVMRSAEQFCPNAVLPNHPTTKPDIFAKDHPCAACHFAQGVLGALAAGAAAFIGPALLAEEAATKGMAAGIGAVTATTVGRIINDAISCTKACAVGQCRDGHDECLKAATIAKDKDGAFNTCVRQFTHCCMAAGGLCEGSGSNSCSSCFADGL